MNSIKTVQAISILKEFDTHDDLIEFAKKVIPEEYLTYVNQPEDIIKILRKLEND
jgi:hypothetical protein